MSKKTKNEVRQSQYDEPIVEVTKKVKKKKENNFELDEAFVGANDWVKNKSKNRRERNLQKKHEKKYHDFDDEF